MRQSQWARAIAPRVTLNERRGTFGEGDSGGDMAKNLFGTDGIRGVAGEYPLDPVTVAAAGAALGRWARQHSESPEVLIGMDTRESGPEIAGQMAAGLKREGVGVHFAGLITTPGVAYLTKNGPFVAGVRSWPRVWSGDRWIARDCRERVGRPSKKKPATRTGFEQTGRTGDGRFAGHGTQVRATELERTWPTSEALGENRAATAGKTGLHAACEHQTIHGTAASRS